MRGYRGYRGTGEGVRGYITVPLGQGCLIFSHRRLFQSATAFYISFHVYTSYHSNSSTAFHLDFSIVRSSGLCFSSSSIHAYTFIRSTVQLLVRMVRFVVVLHAQSMHVERLRQACTSRRSGTDAARLVQAGSRSNIYASPVVCSSPLCAGSPSKCVPPKAPRRPYFLMQSC